MSFIPHLYHDLPQTQSVKISRWKCSVFLKLCLELYQSRYNPSARNINKDTIHMATTSKLSTPLSLGVISLTINVNMDTNN